MSSDVGDTSKPPWRMAPQGFRFADVELTTEPHGDGYVMEIRINWERRRVFFDAAGRVTHVRRADNPRLTEA